MHFEAPQMPFKILCTAPSKKGLSIYVLQYYTRYVNLCYKTCPLTHWESELSNSITVSQWKVSLTSTYKVSRCIDHWDFTLVSYTMETLRLLWFTIAYTLEMQTPQQLLAEGISIDIRNHRPYHTSISHISNVTLGY